VEINSIGEAGLAPASFFGQRQDRAIDATTKIDVARAGLSYKF